MPVNVDVVATSSLGDRSYLAHDGQVAIVVDPQRDIDRVVLLAGGLGVRVTHVVETHLHNDYVSGGLALAKLTGAAYLVASAENVGFDRLPVADGDEIVVSEHIRLAVIATPGHTFHHLSYVLHGDNGPEGVFTGGSLLFGTTGRTDLLGGQHAHDLALHQHASANRLADLLPDGARVWPTHGFGSFCSATRSEAGASTIGREKATNPVLRLEADDYVEQTLAGLDAYPAYYAHMGVRNAEGAELIDLSPAARADAGELRARLDAGEWVVDLRSRKAFARRHLAGTVSVGLDGAMSTWLGWLVPWGAPITLLGESATQVDEAQRELARIGIDRPAAAATGQPETWAGEREESLSELSMTTFADLATARVGDPPHGLPPPSVVLDVRLAGEWRTGHLEDAIHIPLPELVARLDELDRELTGEPDSRSGEGAVWVHCQTGYRSTIAASLLTRAGHRAVSVDDDFDTASSAGLPVTRPEEAAT